MTQPQYHRHARLQLTRTDVSIASLKLANRGFHTPTNQSKMKNSIMLLIAAVAASSLSSCLPLAAGAAAGYVAHEEGYRVQSPIKKSE